MTGSTQWLAAKSNAVQELRLCGFVSASFAFYTRPIQMARHYHFCGSLRQQECLPLCSGYLSDWRLRTPKALSKKQGNSKFAALAIDGSRAFSDERHAQNAADTSALAAALSKIRGNNWNGTVTTARARATTNGYDNNGTSNVVEVYLCSDANATCTALPTGATPADYIQVKIISHVTTYFAKVIRRTEVINQVNAVAHAVPG